ncbi:PREDICTED: peroxisomal membrane protein PEX13 [Dinoponera quadriceps]|uniref:Peroxisomal membrane protein PEX13 n=1 Tax=Dinoponera quadriceps TaxID=609295 RepID=A0A6P3Y0K2_DINQU|nr:PREDICTED: peroxisomal membrane protein PEX13 [Dinoponera quadriceps]
MAPEYNRTNNFQLHNIPPVSTSMPYPFVSATNQPPPVPPRFHTGGYNTGYNIGGYNTGYNTGYNNYRPLGGFNYLNGGFGGGYRNYGGNYGYNNYGHNNYGYNSGDPFYHMSMPNNVPFGNAVNSFQHYVEETTRPVVSVVDSVLSTLSSITAVVESSHFALINSFRAYESLANNTGRMRSTFGQILKTFSLIRLLKWIYRKFLALFGRGKQDRINEMLWKNSMSQMTNEVKDHTSVFGWHMSFLLTTIFAIIPYLIFKIMSNVRRFQFQPSNPSTWLKSERTVPVAIAKYDFMPVSNEELTLKVDQKIWLAPQPVQDKNPPGWVMATDGKTVGLVPRNYIEITGQLMKANKLKEEIDTEMTASDNIASEDVASDQTTS